MSRDDAVRRMLRIGQTVRTKGRFVSKRDGSPHELGHFEVDTVPAPPEAHRWVDMSDMDGSARECVQFSMACPGCHGENVVRYISGELSRSSIARLLDDDWTRHNEAIRTVRAVDDAQRYSAMISRHLHDPDQRDDG